VHRAYSATMPTGRYTLPEEVAGVVLYLSSELSGNVTGTHIVVDGGRSGSGGASAARR
jgi:NAD(P)-dependent dehydrogenase (short-subunit alcohol dehydrogenase family)